MDKKIEEHVKIYKDFWSENILDKINEKIDDWRKGKIHARPHLECRPSMKDVSSHWTKGGIFAYDFWEEEEILTCVKEDLNTIHDLSEYTFFDVSLRIFLSGGSLPWHRDSYKGFVTTTYLNQDPWNKDWGGALLCKNEHGELFEIFPEYNKMIVQDGYYNNKKEIFHATSPIKHKLVSRITLQIFAKTEEEAKKTFDAQKTFQEYQTSQLISI